MKITSLKLVLIFILSIFLFLSKIELPSAGELNIFGKIIVWIIAIAIILFYDQIGKKEIEVRRYSLGVLSLEGIGEDRSKRFAILNIEKNPKNKHRILTPPMSFETFKNRYGVNSLPEGLEKYFVPDQFSEEYVGFEKAYEIGRTYLSKNTRERIENFTLNLEIITVNVRPEIIKKEESNEKDYATVA
jgi:hypothetical protein